MDLIDRQEAIEAMTSGVILVTNNNVDAVKKVMELFIDKIKNLPPVRSERKTGRWIGNPETCEFMTCSACGCEFDWYSEGGVSSFDWNYCPHCGADMRGGQDE